MAEDKTSSNSAGICSVENPDYPGEYSCSFPIGHDQVVLYVDDLSNDNGESAYELYDHGNSSKGAWWNMTNSLPTFSREGNVKESKVINYELFYSEEHEGYEALYADGKLVVMGKKYYVKEKIYDLLGIKYREGDFLLGMNDVERPAQTVQEIEDHEAQLEEYQDLEDMRDAEVFALRAKAQELLDQADKLQNSSPWS